MRQKQHFCFLRQRQTVQQPFRILRYKNSFNPKPGSHSFFNQVRSFDAGQFSAGARGLSQRAA